MTTVNLTDERLRSWLNANQSSRERLCLALLGLIRQYTQIKPRRPMGGPDGGYDIEALFEGRYETKGGIGFRNNVSDSTADKRWVKQKFAKDLETAFQAHPNLPCFIFFTNVDLKPKEVQGLEEAAKKRGVQFVEIFYRESLRILLDSPQGLAFRFQYLSIPLSDAEQAAFFDQFGHQIEELILQKFDSVSKQLAQIRFFTHSLRPLRKLSVRLKFPHEIDFQNLQPLAFQLQILDYHQRPTKALVITGRSTNDALSSVTESLQHIEMQLSVTSKNPDRTIVWNHGVSFVLSGTEIDFSIELPSGIPFATLEECNRKQVFFYATAELFEHLSEVQIIINDLID